MTRSDSPPDRPSHPPNQQRDPDKWWGKEEEEQQRQSPLHSFVDDTRGIAEQIDFLNGIMVLLLGFGLFMASSGVLLDSASHTGRGQDYTSIRSHEALADDLLVETVGDTVLSGECAEAYFNTETTTTTADNCDFNNFDDSSETAYLRSSLGIDSRYEVNVTIEDPSGPLSADVDGDGTSRTFAMGADTPESGTVAAYHRQVTFGQDVSGDGEWDYYTLYVRVWEV